MITYIIYIRLLVYIYIYIACTLSVMPVSMDEPWQSLMLAKFDKLRIYYVGLPLYAYELEVTKY